MALFRSICYGAQMDRGCPNCHASGEMPTFISPSMSIPMDPCPVCKGVGQLSDQDLENAFHGAVEEDRCELAETLGDEMAKRGLDL